MRILTESFWHSRPDGKLHTKNLPLSAYARSLFVLTCRLALSLRRRRDENFRGFHHLLDACDNFNPTPGSHGARDSAPWLQTPK
jgi:hypothetical protein